MSGAEQEWSWPGVAADSDRGGEPGSGVLEEVVLAVLGLGCLRAARWGWWVWLEFRAVSGAQSSQALYWAHRLLEGFLSE